MLTEKKKQGNGGIRHFLESSGKRWYQGVQFLVSMVLARLVAPEKYYQHCTADHLYRHCQCTGSKQL